MPETITRDIEMWQGGGYAGWRLVVYDEAYDRIGYWYGNTRAACEAMPNEAVKMHDMTHPEFGDEFDLACERRFD